MMFVYLECLLVFLDGVIVCLCQGLDSGTMLMQCDPAVDVGKETHGIH
jgi:hypothetical protein